MPRVSALRHGGGTSVEVWLDGHPWRELHEDVVVRAGLTVGVLLDRERAVAVARERRRSRAMVMAVRALRARDHSAASLRERLVVRGTDEAVADETVERLARVGVVDDQRVAALRAETLARRGLGDLAIRADLEARGFEDAIAARAIEGIDPEPERLAALLERHGRSLATVRMLGRKGFAEEALDDLIASLGDSAIA